MSLNSKISLIQRLRRGRDVRARFVDSNISKAIAFQIRALREQRGWSQQRLAEEIGSNQNAIYRAENPNYGKHTITTLKKIAAANDVALAVRFVPYSELIDWVSGTPRTIAGLTTEALSVPDFQSEEYSGAFEHETITKAFRTRRPERRIHSKARRSNRIKLAGALKRKPPVSEIGKEGPLMEATAGQIQLEPVYIDKTSLTSNNNSSIFPVPPRLTVGGNEYSGLSWGR